MIELPAELNHVSRIERSPLPLRHTCNGRKAHYFVVCSGRQHHRLTGITPAKIPKQWWYCLKGLSVHPKRLLQMMKILKSLILGSRGHALVSHITAMIVYYRSNFESAKFYHRDIKEVHCRICYIAHSSWAALIDFVSRRTPEYQRLDHKCSMIQSWQSDFHGV